MSQRIGQVCFYIYIHPDKSFSQVEAILKNATSERCSMVSVAGGGSMSSVGRHIIIPDPEVITPYSVDAELQRYGTLRSEASRDIYIYGISLNGAVKIRSHRGGRVQVESDDGFVEQEALLLGRPDIEVLFINLLGWGTKRGSVNIYLRSRGEPSEEMAREVYERIVRNLGIQAEHVSIFIGNDY